MIVALLRRALWRVILTSTGGVRARGRPPTGPYVVVANHSSHVDTPALIAALPARARPVVAAAADYWFCHRARTWFCRALVAAFPVRRNGGGSADLLAVAPLLADDRAVIIYPEGTRSRNGMLGDFHGGASRLAAHGNVPLVPVAIVGTRAVLPPHGRLRRAPITVHIGAPTTDIDEARAQIAGLVDSIYRL